MYTPIVSNQIGAVLDRSVKAGNAKPPVFMGLYGVAKSSMVAAWCRDNDYHLIDFRLSDRHYNDIRGMALPDRSSEDKVLKWFRDEDWDWHETKTNVVFFDEIGLASTPVFKVAIQAMLDRRIGQMRFPEGTIICAATNKVEHKTGVQKMPAALVDRVALYEVAPDINSFLSYLETDGKSAEVLAFLNANSDAPYNFNINEWDGESNLPTFRSFSRLDELIASYDDIEEAINDPLLLAHTQACIGPKYGIMFAEFIKLAAKVGDVADMVANSRHCHIPQEPDLQWLIACRLITLADKENLNQVFEVAQRLTTPTDYDWRARKEPSMMQMFVGNGLRRRRSDLHRTSDMLNWLSHYGPYLVD